MSDMPVDPDVARAAADAADDPAVADFLRRVADDAERMHTAGTPTGAYARRAITAGPDPEQVAHLTASLDSVAADREFVEAILAAKPEARMIGVDWVEVAAAMIDSPEYETVKAAADGHAIDFLDAADPVLAALRHMEPPARRKWRLTARPEQTLIADSKRMFNLFMGGRGCVAPWTRIYDPITGRHERIDVLAARGEAITVLARADDGRFVPVRTDGAPFLKGVAALFEVTLADGRVITVTDHHRFLTPQGWRRLADVRAEQLLAVAVPALRSAWRRVRTIRPVGIGPFYDMTVPVHENYAAEGFVNHNTGKGFATSNALVEWALAEVGDYAAVAPTLGDARKIVTEGPSGLLVAIGDQLANWNKSEYVIYLKNGSRIILAGAEKPDRLRGLNLRGALIDELASFGANTAELWNEALLPALRIGKYPRLCIATTPRRGNAVLKELVERAGKGDPDVLLVRGSTKDNAANLSAQFIAAIYKRYAGTRLAAQELEGELLDEVEGALLSGDLIERNRIITAEDVPELHRIVVGVDPAVSNTATSDHTGIVVCGIGPAPRGWKPPEGLGILGDAWHLYILDDQSVRSSPEMWARRTLHVAEEWAADCIVAEVNQGGDLVSSQIRMVARASGLGVPRILQVRASVGKAARAEPVAALFEQNRAHFVGGFPELEDEWCGWVPGSSSKSPDRVDACVWAAVQLFPELAIKAASEVRVIA